MVVHASAAEMRRWCLERKAEGKSLGFVPTMGALHEGHASLMREAVRANDCAVLSVFVNPAQFAPHEDFDRYPRTWGADLAIAEKAGIQAIYAPKASAMYPPNYATYVQVERLQDGLCSGTRPHFFKGVATVVAKLFNAVPADRAYFGQKDAQQSAIIRRMARDLDFGIEIVEMPIVREADGLAMSSRNVYLSPEERTRALCLSRALFQVEAVMKVGERDAAKIIAAVRKEMANVDIDYIALVDADEMIPRDRIEGKILLAVAAQVGKTRLIDNIKFGNYGQSKPDLRGSAIEVPL